MNEQAIREIMEEHAHNENTASGYRSAYNAMRKFENRMQKTFEEAPAEMLSAYIADQQCKSVVKINTDLLYIKHYMKKVGYERQVEGISSLDFDISEAMKAAYVVSLEDLYARCSLVYEPENGEAIFPYVSFAWMGLPQTEAQILPDEAVHLDTGKIDTNSRLIFDVMPPSMIKVLLAFRDATQSSKGNGHIKLPDRIGNFMYKTSYAGSKSTGKGVAIGSANFALAKVRDKYVDVYRAPMTTTYKDIEKSARYFKARQMELTGVDWDSSENNKLLQEVFGTNRIEPSYLRHNYKMYKKAFNLR